jgi:hypothetical protein
MDGAVWEPDDVALISETIEQHPDGPVNYLLRAEAWLSAGEPECAASDFEIAQELAARRLSHSAWGYVEQAYLDRAMIGLAECRQLLHLNDRL